MSVSSQMNVGLVGAVKRGGSFVTGLKANGARIHAVCDIQKERVREMAQAHGAEAYTDYAEMIAKSDLDAVVVGTPMPLHVPQAIMALERGLHVLSEVPASVSIEESRRLVAACAQSKGIYMMAENYCYTRPCVIIREMIRQGLFGELYYAEGEYLHELKELNEITPWRRKWQTGVAGITYGTHSLGPILQWMAGDRVARVCCEGTSGRHRDPRGEPYANETAVMLAKTARGALIKIRVDMVSDRPHAMTVLQLQGVDGAYESSRNGPHDINKVWLRALSRQPRWHDLDALMLLDDMAERFIPEFWRNPPPEALKAGHGGGDYFEVGDFLRAARGEAPCPIGIHEAMDMTLPGLVSQQSILQNGAWLDVPDSRKWGRSDAHAPTLRGKAGCEDPRP